MFLFSLVVKPGVYSMCNPLTVGLDHPVLQESNSRDWLCSLRGNCSLNLGGYAINRNLATICTYMHACTYTCTRHESDHLSPLPDNSQLWRMYVHVYFVTPIGFIRLQFRSTCTCTCMCIFSCVYVSLPCMELHSSLCKSGLCIGRLE